MPDSPTRSPHKSPSRKQRSYRSGGVPFGETSARGPSHETPSRGPAADLPAEPPAGGGRHATYGEPRADPDDLGRGWGRNEGAAGFTGVPERTGAEPPLEASTAPPAPSVGVTAHAQSDAGEPPAAGDPATFRGEAAYNQAVREPYGAYQGGYPGAVVEGSGEGPGGGARQPEPAGPSSRFAPEYLAWRAAQLKQLDDDYDAWCRMRQDGFTAEFEAWQRRRAAARRRKTPESS